MNRRTFDILAKYISSECGIKVVISDEVGCPHIKLEEKTIYLPSNIKEDNALAALAVLIHEAAHMKWTVEIPTKEVTSNEDEFNVLNAMEDVRIDLKNFRVLPNIQQFYKIMYRDHSFKPERMEQLKKAPMLMRVLISNILDNEGFHKYNLDLEAQKENRDLGIDILFRLGVNHIQYKQWDELKKTIKEIVAKFKNQQQQQQQQQQQAGGTGEGEGEGVGVGIKCSGDKGKDGKSDGGDKGQAKGISMDDLLHATSVWTKGSGLQGSGGLEFSPAELQETTRRKFIDALSIKEKRIIDDGTVLDTDNLLAFFTGEITELFKDEVIEKKRRSKIVFALDASGSMASQLPLDRKFSRRKALVNTVGSLTNLLDEVIQIEGLAVDYDICAFDDRFHKLNKQTWPTEYYMHSGGTDIHGAFRASKELLSSPEIDGSKMLILITDGCVSPNEITDMRDEIMTDNNDIRVMIVGIGADITGAFVTKIIGDNNIISMEHAEQVLMEAIQTMVS